MATASPPDRSLAEAAVSTPGSPAPAQSAVLAIHAEEIAVSKRQVTRTVQVTRRTQHRDERVEEALAATGVVIEHVPKGYFVDAVPPVRDEGGVTILPVVEEVVVVERRLRLVEEVHVRRVQTTSTHTETVTLREQRVVVSRSDPAIRGAAEPAPLLASNNNPSSERPTMTDTIVAVYDTAAHAEQAVSDLLAANVPQSAIRRHAAEGSYSPNSTAVSARPADGGTGGFWSNLFGGGSSDHDVYDRTLQSGGNVVSVSTVPEHDYEAVMTILEKHNPVDIDERAASYASSTAGLTSAAGTAGAAASAGMVGSSTAARTMSTGSAGTGMAATGTAGRAGMAGDTIQLAEEQLAIGKRLINRGGTRIRRYVVETPVEQAVTLRDEKVTLERRPVTDSRPVTDAAFTDKTIEMTETAEEAVVSKTARVVEEVSLGKTATERTETVRDTVRKEEVEVEQLSGSAGTAGTTITGAKTSGTMTPGATTPGVTTSGTKL